MKINNCKLNKMKKINEKAKNVQKLFINGSVGRSRLINKSV